MRHIRRQLAGESGTEIAEAAVVLPIAFMFLLGIVWFGRAFNIYSTITQAAQQGAVAAARPPCATCGNTTSTAQAAQADAVVSSVMQASHLDLSQISVGPKPALCTVPDQLPANVPNGVCTTTTHNITVCTSAILDPPARTPPNPPNLCGAVVSFQYPFQFYLPFTSLNMQRITMTAQAQSRMEN